MDRLIYVAMTGAKHTLEQQAVVANNLANLSTTGFKAELGAFRAVRSVGPGMPTRTYVVDSTMGADLSPGPTVPTGRPLDIAVTGRGWIAVQGPDGREAYTRDGALQLTPNGVLQTRAGLNVLGDGGPIAIPQNNMITIGADGTVSTIPTDAIPNSVSIVGRIKLVNPPEAALERGADGLFRRTDGGRTQRDETMQVTSGVLEGSNVSPVQMLVEMIGHSRQFEAQVKLLQTAQDDDRGWSNVMNLST
ncbi:MAG TPA: flagellar basal body rod protein FlgF [Burkholderiales bacterium]|nr:flagellar basal body rod protein FlgF [Burkholderiales bacterium]